MAPAPHNPPPPILAGSCERAPQDYGGGTGNTFNCCLCVAQTFLRQAGLCTAGQGARRMYTPRPRSPVETRLATHAPASGGPVALCACPLLLVPCRAPEKIPERVSVVSGVGGFRRAKFDMGESSWQAACPVPGPRQQRCLVLGWARGRRGGRGGLRRAHVIVQRRVPGHGLLGGWPTWEQRE